MPQVSIYLDEDIHREIEMRARLNKTSVSKFVISILKSHFTKDWPDGFQNTFGSISDESFMKQDTVDWSSDTPRENL
ncbi:MAG: hypothetical protein FWD21_03180 [Peptococcaceae bacterium]|nr:hypothetical protein [Peptococcaceae bacterium]